MEDPKSIILNAAQDILIKAGFMATVEWKEGTIPCVSISSQDDLSLLIGKQGQNLGALEHLVRLTALRRFASQEHLPDFILDINEYRKAQTEHVLKLADEVAQRVIETGRAESLTPMSSHERRIVHTQLSSYASLQTESIGTEPHRRVVIKPA